MNDAVGSIYKPGHVSIEIPKMKGIPEPLSKDHHLRKNDGGTLNILACERNDQRVEFEQKQNRVSIDYKASINNLETIIKSLSSLMNPDNGNSGVNLSINIFYQPAYSYLERPQILHAKTQTSIPNNSSNFCPIILNQETIQTLKKNQSPKPLLIENKQLDKVVDNEETPPNFSESYSSNYNQNCVKFKINALEPTKFNLNYKSEEITLRKRQKIDSTCMCANRIKPLFNVQSDPFFDQQITKIKFFWKGTNPSYPFALKKKVMKYYIDTDEISVNDIVDCSQKVIVNDEMMF